MRLKTTTNTIKVKGWLLQVHPLNLKYIQLEKIYFENKIKKKGERVIMNEEIFMSWQRTENRNRVKR